MAFSLQQLPQPTAARTTRHALRHTVNWLPACLHTHPAACEGVVASLPPQSMADCAWALARLRYQPSEEWEEAAVAQASAGWVVQGCGAVLPHSTAVQTSRPRSEEWEEAAAAQASAR